MAQAAVLVEALGDLSLDWLAGHDDVPKQRKERAEIGDLQRGLHRVVADHLADCLEINPDFVQALIPSPADLTDRVLLMVEDAYGPSIEQMRGWKTDQLIAANPSSPTWFFAKELTKAAARRRRAERFSHVRHLPDPGLPKQRRTASQEAKYAAYLQRRAARMGILL